uniref:Uncharacterized protein n=1 Tax=Romanomermis culicivorax TaxID=13658 RepID=A0A915IVI9_ROMCU
MDGSTALAFLKETEKKVAVICPALISLSFENSPPHKFANSTKSLSSTVSSRIHFDLFQKYYDLGRGIMFSSLIISCFNAAIDSTKSYRISIGIVNGVPAIRRRALVTGPTTGHQG